ncbi:hypothetical protein K502DRAFT_344693 [Neoconidiobolus thromboides FSU 785]|nr:hypothetical protein K502DRAFT_344693 [Neoconidiobolus thromboides FSU 785]
MLFQQLKTSRTKLIYNNILKKRYLHQWIPEIQEKLNSFPSVITIPVQWGQQDTFQHLNNVDWLRFIESGRIDYMYLLTLNMDKTEANKFVTGDGAGLIVKSQECKYKHPITYPDSLTVATKIENLTRDRFVFYTLTYSLKHQKLASESKVLCVSYDHKKLEKSDFSESFVKAVIKMEKNPEKIHKEAMELPIRKY